MRIDKGYISGNQFMFSIACFIQSSALLTAFLASVTLQDSWIVVLFGSALCCLIILVYRAIMLTFPDKNLIQILEEVFGSVIGKILGAAYIWFFLTLTSLTLLDLSNFTKLTIMQETPNYVLMIMCILVSAIAVRHGIRLVAKYSALFCVIVSSILLFSLLLLLNQIKLENFFPIFNLPLKNYIQGTHLIFTIPFGEIVVFLMIHPNVKLSIQTSTKYIFIGFGIGVLTILTVLFQDIGVLGSIIDMFSMPTLVTLRLVNLGGALSRMEVLFAVVLVMLMFFKITILYYVSVIAVAQIFKAKLYRHLALAAGALIICSALILYPNPIQHTEAAISITPFIWTLFQVLIPLLILIIAKMKCGKKLKEA